MKCWICMTVMAILVPHAGYGYRRLSYINPSFVSLGSNNGALLDDIVHHNVVQNKKTVTYSSSSASSRRDFVYLSRMDRWRIARALRSHKATDVLTPDLVNAIVAPLGGKRKMVVRHVLQDFARQPGATVGSILHALALSEVVS